MKQATTNDKLGLYATSVVIPAYGKALTVARAASMRADFMLILVDDDHATSQHVLLAKRRIFAPSRFTIEEVPVEDRGEMQQWLAFVTDAEAAALEATTEKKMLQTMAQANGCRMKLKALYEVYVAERDLTAHIAALRAGAPDV